MMGGIQTTRPRMVCMLWLALQDLCRDKAVSLCMVAAVLAVVGPLLLLLGLSNGVVDQMRHDLAQQPSHLEIRMLGHHQLSQEWLDQWERDPRVGFVIPMTRSLNTTADLRATSRDFLTDVELLASRTGDPVLLGMPGPESVQSIVLSHSAANRLNVASGNKLQLIVSRQRQGQTERLAVPVTVQSVLPVAAFARDAALVDLRLLLALEDFRDGADWPAPGLTNLDREPRARQFYPRARFYAATWDDVAPLVNELQQQGYETSSRLAEIEAVSAVDRLLGVVFGVIAWLAILGGLACLIGGFMANLDRKRKDLALLCLMGYGRDALLLYVLVQVLTIVMIGFAAGMAAYGVGSQVFDSYLGQALPQGAYVSQLAALDVILSFGLSLAVAVLVSILGGWVAMRVEPAESLRGQ